MPSGRSRSVEPLGPGGRARRPSSSSSSARAARPSGSTSGSSVKSRLASRWATTSSRWSRRARIGPDRPPASCCEGRVELGRVRGVDDAQHRLGPRQVDPAGEERAQGELARLGLPRASRQAVGQDQAHQRRRADQVDLGHVLAGVGPRRRPEGEHRRARAAAGRQPSEFAARSVGVSRRRGLVRSSDETRRARSTTPPAPRAARSRAAAGPGGLATAAIVSFGSSAIGIVSVGRMTA